ncbi:t-SNARE [Daedaleopsis nitida]|nr:t-SNARE [Daedaleopsis nitida]
MNTDKLAAFRQQRGQAHEMTNMHAQFNGAGNGADPMDAFLNQVSDVQNGIATFSQNVNRISELHSRTLNTADDGASRHNAAMLDELVGETRKLSNELKEKIQALSAYPVSRVQDQNMRKNQTSMLRQKFVEVLQNYQQEERDYRQKYKQRVERQFRIVKPDATPDEVAAVVNDTDGTGAQIFTQALSSSTRYGESRMVYREVQDRHNDIQKIERTLEELAQLFSDMSVLVAQQDEAIDQIQVTAGKVEDDTRKGTKETEIAVDHARRARRMRKICFGIFVFVIAVLALVLGLYFGLRAKSNNNNSQ